MTESSLSHDNRFRYYDPSIGRYISGDPIGQRGGINLFSYARLNPLIRIDPLGLNDCYAFVSALVQAFLAAPNSTTLGQNLLANRGTTLPANATGFKPSLVSGGQGGQVSRHIYGHAGAVLAYPYGPGTAASFANQGIDYAQRFQKGRTAAQSEAEIADDQAARNVADALADAFKRRDDAVAAAAQQQQCPNISGISADLEKALRNILCK